MTPLGWLGRKTSTQTNHDNGLIGMFAGLYTTPIQYFFASCIIVTAVYSEAILSRAKIALPYIERIDIQSSISSFFVFKTV